jgi:hypothetical protein
LAQIAAFDQTLAFLFGVKLVSFTAYLLVSDSHWWAR